MCCGANHEALQQRGPFTWWSLPAICSPRCGIRLHTLFMLLVLRPGDVAVVRALDEDPLQCQKATQQSLTVRDLADTGIAAGGPPPPARGAHQASISTPAASPHAKPPLLARSSAP